MRTIIKIMILTIALSMLFSGCVEDKGTTQPRDILEDSKQVVELAKQDAITRFNLAEDEINVDVIPTEWRDTSLGYPEQGKDYEIENIKGYTILIYAKGKVYEYHSDYHRIAPPKGPQDLETMPIIVPDNSTAT